MNLITKYFQSLTSRQIEQFAILERRYPEWNAKINVISRKDIYNLEVNHLLHSLAIAKFIEFTPGTKVLDFGTGGGFPAIPLAVLFPEVMFHLVDRIGKKLKVAESISQEAGLSNVTIQHGDIKEVKGQYDFVVSRAVMELGKMVPLLKRLVPAHEAMRNPLPNGLICLKGGDLDQELSDFRDSVVVDSISRYFDEPFLKRKNSLLTVMKIVRFEVNPFGENTYVAYDENSNDAVVIDPGMMNQHERDGVIQFLTGHSLHVKCVLITHIHVDHVASAAWLAQQCAAPVYASESDAPLSAALPAQAQRFGLRISIEPLAIDKYVKEGDKLLVGGEEIQVIAVPGHSLGGLAFYLPQSSTVFVGDSVFLGSIGRTDLPGGSQSQLIQNVKSKILTLPADTLILPGHGPSTTVGDEQATNPYLR